MQLTSNFVLYYLFLSIAISGIIEAENEPFKINKLNLVWTKAQHSLGTSKLKDLKNDLNKHEVDELTLKKMKAHNQDKEGLFEASVRKRLLTILSKYKLERFYNDIHPPIEDEHILKKNNLQKVKDKDGKVVEEVAGTFRDKKLDKLWKKAEQSGFTQEELMVLHDEFQHQQDKLDEHYDTMNSIEQELHGNLMKTRKLENSIEEDEEPKKESEPEKKARLETIANQALKEKHSDIKKNIAKLQEKIASGKVNNAGDLFEETPVNNLWLAATQSNFTEAELESLKEELEHYESRIKKLKHFQVQLERDEIVGPKKSQSQDEDSDETKHIRRRVEELSQKVDKIHKSIEKKILTYRDEL